MDHPFYLPISIMYTDFITFLFPNFYSLNNYNGLTIRLVQFLNLYLLFIFIYLLDPSLSDANFRELFCIRYNKNTENSEDLFCSLYDMFI